MFDNRTIIHKTKYIIKQKNAYNINVAMINKKINQIRKKLDKLDVKMLLIIKKRSVLVNKILKEKKYKKQIVDNKRIKLILKKIKNESIKKKIDPKITNNIWKAMIRSFINYEFRNFNKK